MTEFRIAEFRTVEFSHVFNLPNSENMQARINVFDFLENQKSARVLQFIYFLGNDNTFS